MARISIKSRDNAAVATIIFLNALVFIFWRTSTQINFDFMTANFLVSWQALEQKRFWTLITSVFSQIGFWHFLLNMYILYGFGSALEQYLGTLKFLVLYLLAGVIASLTHCLVSNYLLGQPELSALGASGAIAGIVLVFSLIFPRAKVWLFGFIPVASIWGVIALIVLDIFGLLAQFRGTGLPIGHGAHLGGAVAGLLFYLWPKTCST